jgi:hypothetical protein
LFFFIFFFCCSDEIEKVAKGEGERIDAYLQLKTCPSERLMGKILIDSPGFDADAQRTSTLRITDHIIDLSDLVLVMFDARHPEPGAMQDTLNHLIDRTIHRADTGKFLYILNQIDTTARENNPEDVIAAWQRALGERGLTAGRFYAIYNPEAAVPIEDEALRKRYEMKRDLDLSEIHNRMEEVEIERAYRIVGALEKTARDIEERSIPLVIRSLAQWRKRVIWTDAVVMGAFGLLLLALTIKAQYWTGFSFTPPWMQEGSNPIIPWLTLVIILIALLLIHFGVRAVAAKTLIPSLRKAASKANLKSNPVGAFRHSIKPWRSIFLKTPAGWGRKARKQVSKVIQDTDTYVQTLNDEFTNPSGSEKVLIGSETAPIPDPGEETPAQDQTDSR